MRTERIVLFMKITIELDLSDENDLAKYECIKQADGMSLALFDIANDVFRPHRKHGYSDVDIKLTDDVVDAIGKLEEMFWKIVNERGVEIP